MKSSLKLTVLVKIVKHRHHTLVVERFEIGPAYLEASIEFSAGELTRYIFEQKRLRVRRVGWLQRGQEIWITVHVEVPASQRYRVGVHWTTRRKDPKKQSNFI